MKKEKKKVSILYILIVLLALLLLVAGNRVTTKGNPVFGKSSVAPVFPAKVELILAKNFTDPESATELQIHFEAKILSGEKKGESVLVRQFLSSVYPVQVKEVEEGDSIIVRYTEFGEENIWVFQEYNRSKGLIMLVVLFILLLFIFGGKKGVTTVVSLTLTFACVFYYFLPAILSGQNIYLATVLSCVYITIITLILVNGLSDKTFSVALGCFGGLLAAGVLFKIMDTVLKLTGIISEESSYLLIMDDEINLKAIMFASILIGVLGGVLDVGVSIASSLSEIYPKDGHHRFKKIFASGMNIGRDIISTMTNTLILVYIGSALSSTMLLVVYSNSFLELINREAIIFEVLQALIGSIGLLFTIPLTTIFYAFSLSEKPKTAKMKTAAVKKSEIFELAEPETIVANKMPKELKSPKNKNPL